MPRPFNNQEFNFTQPDGTTFTLFGFGNQRFAVFEDADGYVVIENPATGFYQYAILGAAGAEFEASGINVGEGDPASLGVEKHIRTNHGVAPVTASFSPPAMPGGGKMRWEERIEEKRLQRLAVRQAARDGLVMAPPSIETTGDFIGLCINIEFPDVVATIDSSEVDKFCNQIGYSGFGNNGSVHDYFLDVSNGRMRYNNKVTGYYRAEKPRSHYTDESIPFGQRAHELISEAILDLKNSGFDFSTLTADSAGFVRALNIFYVGPRVNNWSKGLWPHAWRLSNPIQVAPGKILRDYQFTNMGSELALGTFCHENGHMVCDFPDLYDYKADNFRSSGIGDYCLMCAGGSDEKNPVRVGAYLNRMAGWAQDVTVVTPGLNGTLAANRDEFLIHSKTADEYFIVEHRNAQGRDIDLPSSGLAIWHVDHNGSNEHQQGTPARHYECALEQADGQFDLEAGNGQGDAGDLFSAPTHTTFGDGTNPDSRWWDNTSSGLEIEGIGNAGGDISYRIPGAGTDLTIISGESQPALAIPDDDLAGVSDIIALNSKGKIGFIEVSVDISHSYKGDLKLNLRSPAGTIAVLHNRSGFGTDDIKETYNSENLEALGNLLEEEIRGNWALEVSDHAAVDVGIVNSWSITIHRLEETSSEIGESVGIMIPDDNSAGIIRSLAAVGTEKISTISVMVDITHTFTGDLVVSIVSPAGTRINLHDRAGGSSDNIIQTYTSVTTPQLTSLEGELIGGNWELHVSDQEGDDTGKLNRWSVLFQT